jgi:hypothetical protein
MRKMLLIVATLGAFALIPAPASAQGHDFGLRHVASSLGVKIIVHDAPKVVHYRHHPRSHLRPQPWFRHYHHHAPRWGWHKPSRWSWHKPWRSGPSHFQPRPRDHHPWFRGPDRPRGPALRHGAPRGKHLGWRGGRHDRVRHR